MWVPKNIVNQIGILSGICRHKLLMCRLGRAVKMSLIILERRLDLVGAFVGWAVPNPLSKTYQGSARKHLKRCLDEGKRFNIVAAFKSSHITNSLKYSLLVIRYSRVAIVESIDIFTVLVAFAAMQHAIGGSLGGATGLLLSGATTTKESALSYKNTRGTNQHICSANPILPLMPVSPL